MLRFSLQFCFRSVSLLRVQTEPALPPHRVSRGPPHGVGSCAAVIPSVHWTPLSADTPCADPRLAFNSADGRRTEVSTLFNASAAVSLSARLPAGRLAWTALSTNASATWAWADNRSSYALSDGRAWAGGAVPPSTPASCAALEAGTGLLHAVDCTNASAASFALCSIPACTCQGAQCSTAVHYGTWAGYACAPAGETWNITGVHVFRGYTSASSVPKDVSQAAGCGQRLNSTQEAEVLLSGIRLVAGDVLRLCGDLPSQTALYTPWPPDFQQLDALGNVYRRRINTGEDCDLGGTAGNQSCQQWAIKDKHGSGFGRDAVLAVGDWHVCAVLTPGAKGHCWGVPGQVAPGILTHKPTGRHAVSVFAGGATTCVSYLAGEDEDCWEGSMALGGEAQILLPDPTVLGVSPGWAGFAIGQGFVCGLSYETTTRIACTAPEVANSIPSFRSVSSIAASDLTTCAIEAVTGTLSCWGGCASSACYPPVDLGPVDTVVMSGQLRCAILRGTGRVRCWGYMLIRGQGRVAEAPGIPAILGPIAHIAIQKDLVCVIRAANGQLVCYTATGVYDLPPLLPPLATVALAPTFLCGITASEGHLLCWGDDPALVPTVPRAGDVKVQLPTGSGFAVLRDTTNGTRAPGSSFFPAQAVPLGIQQGVLLQVTEVQWRPPRFGLDTIVRLQRAPIADPSAIPFAASFDSLGGLSMPSIVLYKQGTLAMDGPDKQDRLMTEPCRFMELEAPQGDESVSAYAVLCYSDTFVYGVQVDAFNGTDVVSQVRRSPVEVRLDGVTWRAGPVSENIVEEPSVDIAALLPHMRAVLLANSGLPSVPVVSSSVLPVRPGDEITLIGEGFGMNARYVQDLPWWNGASSATAADPPSSILRSCIHLAWWASPASYHNDSACVCNGREDWLGEGEVPSGYILQWEEGQIRFMVPHGEGIREIRVCVEGRSQLGTWTSGLAALRNGTGSALPRLSFFLAYEPPVANDIVPARYVDSTDVDTPVGMRMRVFAPASATPGPSLDWGSCEATDAGIAPLLPGDPRGRVRYAQRMKVEEYTSRIRFCTSTLLIRDSLGRCLAEGGLNGTLPLWPFSAQAAVQGCAPALKLSQKKRGTKVEAMKTIDTGLVLVMPNAVREVVLSVVVSDAGALLAPSCELPFTFERSPPILRALSPNPLLLGPVGGVDEHGATEDAVLTLYGTGFRTPAEVVDPRNGLLGRTPNATVLVSGVPCTHVSVVRTEASFSYVTCVYPSALLRGGLQSVVLHMVDTNTSLTAGDNTRAALSVRCAKGYYGLFREEGHQTCRKCPPGFVCEEGEGVVPVASPGYYNLGLPPARDFAEADSAPWVGYAWRGVVALFRPSACPPGAAEGGRPLACIVPCEPAAACLGKNVCSEGYVSQAPMWRCSACAAGYFRATGLCVKCPVLGPGAALPLLVVVIVAVACLFLLSSNRIQLWTANIVLEYLQVMSLLQGPTLPWPQSVRELLNYMSLFLLNVEIVAPECWSNITVTPENKLLIIIVLPAAIVLSAAVLYLGMGLGKRLLLGAQPSRARDRSARVLAIGKGSSSSTLTSRMQSVFSGATWSHGPAVCRTVLKLLGMLYLPVVKASLEVWNCTPTAPSDGQEYLSVAFEPCSVPAGLQQRMVPWAACGLFFYGAMYPLLMAWFFYAYHELITEDQLLLAAGAGDDRRTNPRAYMLRQTCSSLYDGYRPGFHHLALLTHARRALVCICALMLTKNAILLAAAVVFVVASCLAVHNVTRPLMSPGVGHMTALAQLVARVQTGKGEKDRRLYDHLVDIAQRSRVPLLVDLAAGLIPSSDMEEAAAHWSSAAVEWNLLEAELQLQVVLAGLLSVMYTASYGTPYEARAAPAVAAIFFALHIVAVGHILVSVGYDLALQLQRALKDVLGDAEVRAVVDVDSSSRSVGGKGGVRGMEGEDAAELVDMGEALTDPALLLYLCCCPCLGSRVRARALILSMEAPRKDSDNASSEEAPWTRNPIESRAAGAGVGVGAASASAPMQPAAPAGVPQGKRKLAHSHGLSSEAQSRRVLLNNPLHAAKADPTAEAEVDAALSALWKAADKTGGHEGQLLGQHVAVLQKRLRKSGGVS